MTKDMKKEAALEQSPVWLTVLALWIVLLIFTGYDPGSVRDQVRKSEQLNGQAWLTQALTELMKAGDTLGISKVKTGLNQVRSKLNAPYLIFEEEVEVAVSPKKDPAAFAKTDAGAAPEKRPPARIHHVSKAKQRILIVGASSIQFAIGTELERKLPTYENVKVLRFGKLASGLARPDYFDWPKKIEELIKQFKPDLMIANFGGNGAQAIPLANYKEAKFRTPEWDVEYAKRVQEIVHIGQDNGVDVVFLGMPNMRSRKFAKKMRYLNRVQRKAVEDKGAIWISTWDLSSGPKGEYRKLIRIGRKRGLMRTSDGVHYSRLGAKFVIENVMQGLEQEFYFVSPREDYATTRRHILEFVDKKHQLEYLEYRPRGLDKHRPYLVISSTRADSRKACSSLPHRRLQSLSQEYQVGILVLQSCGTVIPSDDLKGFTEDFEEHSSFKSTLHFASPFSGPKTQFEAQLVTELNSLKVESSPPAEASD